MKMAFFKQRIKVIEAFVWDGEKAGKPQWFLDALDLSAVQINSIAYIEPALSILTENGRKRADVGDWVIRCPEGNITTKKPSIFNACYEEVP